MDHPILLGSPDPTTANKSLDFTSHISTETFMSKEAPAKPVIVSDPEPLRLTQVWSAFIPALLHCSQSWAFFLMSGHPAMSPCRMWLQTELMEVSVRRRWPWGTKVNSKAHNQKGYEIDLDDYFCTANQKGEKNNHQWGARACWKLLENDFWKCIYGNLFQQNKIDTSLATLNVCLIDLFKVVSPLVNPVCLL